MLGNLSHVEKIYIRCGYTDMRKQLNGLLDIIQYNFKLDPYSNSLFLFYGKRADRIKAVHYEGDGFCLLYKRYENGRLQWSRTGDWLFLMDWNWLFLLILGWLFQADSNRILLCRILTAFSIWIANLFRNYLLKLSTGISINMAKQNKKRQPNDCLFCCM